MRRTLLFLPGNNPGNVQNGGIFGADGIILDLEDAVSPSEKDSARNLVANALRNIHYGTCEKVVRINPLISGGEKDIQTIVPCQPDALMLPKIERAEDVIRQVELIEKAETNGQKPVSVMPLLESPMGVSQALEIALSSKRVVALCFGAEDYTAALGVPRTKDGKEIFVARSMIANAAAAAGVDSIDTPFTDVQDEEGLVEDVRLMKSLGFKGKLVINPRQIDTVHELYAPTTKEIRWAQRVISALDEGRAKGTGVIAVDGKMIDAPIEARAKRILQLAEMLHLL
ncbi:CoA ester lyase [Megasphaera sp. ASD88]|jgi:citrate lyase subunit beta/citryl-CoA lyase|uniref:HpcH/HpaI aldolase/citrate lyase family protein n=1 Tax=Megasphaera sp. ASD88 TaxID=2027407 RepID=UPI000BABB2D4|nr:aldolase/citrate lyase family protein [Megasphaera sp. ASD88]PAV38999.1 CoA ester lyase [Megasphaera sp. ASD88]